MILAMTMFRRRTEEIARKMEALVQEMQNALPSRSEAGAAIAPQPSQDTARDVMAVVGWVSAAVGAVALGLFVGRELRGRYKFKRRTPYDFYSHAGDNVQDVDCGVGV